MNLIRPNGMVERLNRVRPQVEFDGYGRPQPGRSSAESVRLAAQRDRRRQQRRRPDPLRGRLVDMTA